MADKGEFWKDGAPDPNLEKSGTDPGKGQFWKDGAPDPNLDKASAASASGSLTVKVPALGASGWVKVTGSGGLTAAAGALSGSGSIQNLSAGGITLPAPALQGSGWVSVIGTGGLTVGFDPFGAEALFGPVHLSQEGRQVVTAEDTPLARLTQMGRAAVTAESDPLSRLTQMARQVLYPFTCPGAGPTPPIDIPVRVLSSQLLPRWKLERYDIKPRVEERMAGNPIGGSQNPSWTADGIRWKLQRFDIASTAQERA